MRAQQAKNADEEKKYKIFKTIIETKNHIPLSQGESQMAIKPQTEKVSRSK
jgi:hypothetical protein